MRIDKFLAEKYGSRNKAAEAINKGLILVNGKSVAPSYEVKDSDNLTFIAAEESFVSNGGYKLSKALRDFDFSVKDMTIADVGASNGGFTDCLLQKGAQKVYCIDVGESQLDDSLKTKNVVIYDNFNARNLTKQSFPEIIDGATIDVSFISLTYILPNVAKVLYEGGFIIALIKPQFELNKSKVGKNGIVKDAALHKEVIEKILQFAYSIGLGTSKITTAPVKKDKNIEYLVLLVKGSKEKIDIKNINKYVKL